MSSPINASYEQYQKIKDYNKFIKQGAEYAINNQLNES